MKRICSQCLICVAVLLMFCVVTESSAHAQGGNPCGAGGCAYPGWFGYTASPYSLGQIPTPPYYALHPPVYYSVPVPRTYGYSPYAYPGSVRTPEVEIPEIIENPHAKNKPEVAPTRTVSNQIIDNPYVRSELKERLSTQYAAFEAE